MKSALMLVIESRKRSIRENFLIGLGVRANDTRPTYCGHHPGSASVVESGVRRRRKASSSSKRNPKKRRRRCTEVVDICMAEPPPLRKHSLLPRNRFSVKLLVALEPVDRMRANRTEDCQSPERIIQSANSRERMIGRSSDAKRREETDTSIRREPGRNTAVRD